VKNTDTFQPSAAAVEARMNGGYAQSSVPLVAMIVIEGVLASLNSASFASSLSAKIASTRSLIMRSSIALSTTGVSVVSSMVTLCTERERE
jgi:hypothetical protein